MNRPPAVLPAFETAPPTKRAKPDGTPVRLYHGALVAHVNQEVVGRLLEMGAAESCRNGTRRYLRLREGIKVPRTDRGWDIIEFLRRWHGDKRASAYVAHVDRRSEKLLYRSPERPAGERVE